MKILFLFFYLSTTFTHAQLLPFGGSDTAQSSSDHSWKKLENDFVEVYFPEGWEYDAQRAAHFIKQYAPVVGKSYEIKKPQKFPLILRPEVALPNGFVTWMPRRSEWFSHQSYTPFIGGLDFFQALAIHEYRHVNQFDFSKRRVNKVLYWFFGEYGLALMNSISVPSWFFEGDAVWAETRYTDGGRGRSPRFSARLKALLLSEQIPTYDELIGDTYKTQLPNHYVFGYHFVKRATRRFGLGFWKKVFNGITGFPINPYRIYQKFEEYSGEEWEVFVSETFQELKSSWEARGDRLPKIEKYKAGFKEIRFPLKDRGDVFYLKKELNDYWSLHKEGENEKIVELNIIPDISKIDLKGGQLIYGQYLPDLRYSFKSSHDLFLFDLETKNKKKLTDGRRIYHPQWLVPGQSIIVLEKVEGGKFQISLFDQSGRQIGRHGFKNWVPLELAVKNANEVFLLLQDKIGRRSITLYNLAKKSLNRLTPYTRNNLANLRAGRSGVLFEGDYEGRVQAMHLVGKDLKACSRVPIMAYNPSQIGEEVWYASERENGQRLEKTKLNECVTIKSSGFFKGEIAAKDPGVSTGLVSQNVDLKMSSLKNEPTSTFTEGLTGSAPNSWSFLGGRGYQVEVQGRSFLGTFSYLFNLGIDAEESAPYSNLVLSYNPFAVTVSAVGAFEKRKSRILSGGPTVEWTEQEGGLRFNLPFTWVSDFYSHNLRLGINGGIINVGDITGASISRPNNETLNYVGAEFSWSFLKRLTYQQIYPEWGLRTRAFHRKVTSDRRPSFDSDLTFLEASLFLPGFLENNGIRLRGTHETQTEGLFNYRHGTIAEQASDYAFSRGFTYGYVDSFTKGSFDYVFPLVHTEWNLWDYYYLRRLYLTAFYDYTEYEIFGFNGDLQSFGGELSFESLFFRRLPLTYGLRYSQKIDSDQVWDFYIASQFTF